MIHMSLNQIPDFMLSDAVGSVKDKIAVLSGVGGVVEKTNKSEFDEYKAENVQQLSDIGLSYKRDVNKIKKNNETKVSNKIFTTFTQDDLTNIIKTTGVVVDGSGNLTLDATASATSDHTHVALIDSFSSNTIKSIEYELTENFLLSTYPVRLAFGVDQKNFFYFNVATGETYLVENGVLTSITKPVAYTYITTLSIGDKFRINYYNDNFQIFYNNVLIGNVVTTTLLSQEFKRINRVLGGFSFKKYANKYNVKKVTLQPNNRKNKFMHLSFDDELQIFRDLTNHTEYTSIFNHPTFAFLKDIHDKYGVIVSFYCYYQNTALAFDLTQMTARFKTEFQENSDWFKLGFHGYNSSTLYDGSVSDADAKTHYDNFITQVIRFAGVESIDRVTRFSSYKGTIGNMRVWRDTYKGIVGALAAHDTRVSYYHTTLQTTAVQSFDELIDYTENLSFYKSDILLEDFADPVSTLTSRISDIAYASQMDMLIVMTHYGFLESSTPSVVDLMKTKIENVCRFALDNGYMFEFPQKYLL